LTGSVGSIFKIPDLRRKIIFTLAMVVVYRLGGHIPTPGINAHALAYMLGQMRGTVFHGADFQPVIRQRVARPYRQRPIPDPSRVRSVEGDGGVDSPLEKNQDLKAVLLEETLGATSAQGE